MKTLSKPPHVGAKPASLPSLPQERRLFLGLLLALSLASPHPHSLWLLTAGSAPSTRPTSLHRYFLRKTYHLRLDQSADYAEAAAAPTHNPPQASTSLSLPFTFSLFSFSVSLFSLSLFFPLSLFLAVSVFLLFFPFPPFSPKCLRTETRYRQRTKNA